MADEPTSWWRDVHLRAHQHASPVTIHTVLGPVVVLAPPGCVAGLSWPGAAIVAGRAADPVMTVTVTADPLPSAWTGLLVSSEAIVSRLRGRGTFPLRFLPGQPWIAQWDDGPAVARLGSDVVLAVADCDEPHRWLNRVLRDAMVHAGARLGFRPGHAAVVGIDATGVAFVGRSGVGKTDAAMRLAHESGASLLSLDRILVGVRDGCLVAGPLMFAANVHLKTLDSLGVDVGDVVRRHRPVNDKVYVPIHELEGLVGPMLSESLVGHVVVLDPQPRQSPAPAVDAHRLLKLEEGDHAFDVDYLGLSCTDGLGTGTGADVGAHAEVDVPVTVMPRLPGTPVSWPPQTEGALSAPMVAPTHDLGDDLTGVVP